MGKQSEKETESTSGHSKLLKDLKAIPNPGSAVADIIKRAEKGEFGDFTSPHMAPKLFLIQLLGKIPVAISATLIENVSNGDSDD